MRPDANLAIKALSPLREQLGPQYLAYWVLPNVILTLSGARAYCDGVFWDNDEEDVLRKWGQEIAESAAIIKKGSKVLWSEQGIKEARPGEKYAGYDFIFEAGLLYVLTNTSLLSGALVDQLKHCATAEDFSKLMVDNLRSQTKFENLSAENLNDIAFGILVGYPDKAIVESVKSWQDEQDESNAFSESLMDADIRGANYYICPQPVYSYPRHLVNDSTITANEKLWSSILKDYYTSDFHQSLESETTFQQRMQELGNLK